MPSSSLTKRLMIFDLAVGGHHPSYIRYLAEFWGEVEIQIKLFVVVLPEFLEKHSDVVNLSGPSLNFISISPHEAGQISQTRSIIARAFLEWEVYCKYAAELQADHGFLMYFDHLQLPIVFGKPSPCPFSGIYFRPSFHYKYFDDHTPTFRDAWRGRRQKALLWFTLRDSQLSRLLCLDQYAIPHISPMLPPGKHIESLPDPVKTLPKDPLEIEGIKKELGIEAGRKVFLLFGRLSDRKGIFQILEAVRYLERDIAQKVCILLTGEIPSEIKSAVLDLIYTFGQNSTVQIILKDEYLPDSIVHSYFHITDFVLAAYQKHVGMSGIMLLSLVYRKPIIASSYGLLGEFTRRHRIGLTLNASNPLEISQGVTHLINNPDDFSLEDWRVKEILSNHKPQSFASKIFSTAYGDL